MKASRSPWIQVGIIFLPIALLALALFAGVLHYGFVSYDDPEILGGNRLVEHFDLKGMFFGFAAGDYMPLTFLVLALNYLIGGWDPFYFHLTNLTLHLADTFFVMWLAFSLSRGNRLLSAFMGALFAVHPLHVETLAWVSGIKDLLCSFFYFPGLILYVAYLRDPGRRRSLHLCFAFFVAAFFAKAMAISFPLILVLLDYWEGRKLDRAAWIEKLPFLAVALGLAIVHMQVHGRDFSNAPTVMSLATLPLTLLNSLAFYLSKSLIPTALGVYYEKGAVSLEAWNYVLAAALIAGLVFAAWKGKRARVAVIFGSAFFLITLAPVLKVVSFGSNFIYADRYMYLPSFGLFLAIFSVLAEALSTRGIFLSLAPVMVVFSAISAELAPSWRNTETLWLNVLKNYPRCANCYLNLGVEYDKQKRFGEAIAAFKKSLELGIYTPASAHNDLGISYRQTGDTESAWREFRAAAAMDSHDDLCHYNLASLYKDAKQYTEAIPEYRRAIELKPEMVPYYLGLAEAYARSGALDESEQVLLQGLAVDPDGKELRSNLNLVRRLRQKRLEGSGIQ